MSFQLLATWPTWAWAKALSGARVFNVLPRWDKLLEGGVNESAPTANLQRTEIAWAVAGRGSDNNDRVLVYNWSTEAWWVYSCPFGISAIARGFDSKGTERLLFGSEDGHVMVLHDAPTDDGSAIDSRAKCVPLDVAKDRAAALVGMMVTARSLGQAETIRLRAFIEDRGAAMREANLSFDANQAALGDSLPFTLGDDRYLTRRFNLPVNAKGHVFQYEIGGTSRWRLRRAELLGRSLGRRGRAP